jgi:hypothetical protein
MHQNQPIEETINFKTNIKKQNEDHTIMLFIPTAMREVNKTDI